MMTVATREYDTGRGSAHFKNEDHTASVYLSYPLDETSANW